MTGPPTISSGCQPKSCDRVLVHEGEDAVPVPAQHDAVDALDELAVELVARPPGVPLPLPLGDVSRVDGEAAIGERVGGAVQATRSPAALATSNSVMDLLAHRLLQRSELEPGELREGELAEVLTEQLVLAHARHLQGGGVREGEAPVVVDGDEALEAAEDPVEELLARLQRRQQRLASDRLDLPVCVPCRLVHPSPRRPMFSDCTQKMGQVSVGRRKT